MAIVLEYAAFFGSLRTAIVFVFFLVKILSSTLIIIDMSEEFLF